uniref:Uncharacterized protein n=1 Tax=uncultured Thiotrichaceae bacterium TaxID=298394 RepID=A0A6S6UP12_9GAMM|nr:MAG: Unknown protein [uncultured Thiotrichaceae bacterium]
MKTAISIPDPIFEAAESLASNLGMSRSEIFTKAMIEFIEVQRHKNVTTRLNAIYAQEQSLLNAEVTKMQYESIGHEDWQNNEAW